MPRLYEYQCDGCGATVATAEPADSTPCPRCNSLARRDFSFGIARSIPEHFNNSVGHYVTNERQLRDALKSRSEETSHRLGIDHNFEYLSPHDMADSSSHGVTEEGLDATARVHHDAMQ